MSSGPLSQAVLEGASITEVIFTYGTDCAEDGFDFDVVGLPNGVFWSRSGEDLIVSGAAETEPGIYEYYAIIRVNNSSESASVTGFIEVSGNGTSTQECSLLTCLCLDGPQFLRAVQVGASNNHDVVFGFESDCSESKYQCPLKDFPNGVSWAGSSKRTLLSRGQAEDAPAGSYVYVDFCNKKCSYCFW